MAGFVGNKYYNDPNLGRVAAGLSSLFAPPAARDIAAMNQDKRLQMLFESGTDPSASSALIGVQGYGQTPTGFGAGLKSAESIAENDAAQRLAGVRYTADQNRLGVQYGADKDLLGTIFDTSYGPLDQGQVRPAVPADEAAMFGLSGGIAGAAGAPKPLTTDEVEAALIKELVDNDPDMRLAYGLNNLDREKIVGPNGPVLTFGGMAAASGAEPYINNGAEAAPETANYAAPGGLRGTAYFDRTDNTYKDTQTGAPIPPGSQIFNAQAQGSAKDVTGVTGAVETDIGRLRGTITQSNLLLDDLQALVNSEEGASGAPGKIKMLVQDFGQVARELANSFPDGAAMVPPGALQAMGEGVGGEGDYNPVYRQIRAAVLQLAYLNAQRDKRGGEVSRWDLQRQLEALSQGLLGNDQSISAVIAINRQANARAWEAGRAMVGERPVYLGPQDDAAPTPGGGTTVRRFRYDAATDTLHGTGGETQ